MEEIIIRSPNGKESLTLSGGALKLRRKKNETIIPLSQSIEFVYSADYQEQVQKCVSA